MTAIAIGLAGYWVACSIDKLTSVLSDALVEYRKRNPDK